MAYVLAAIVSWGAYFPFAKILLLKLSPEVFLAFRLGLGTLVLGALAVRYGSGAWLRGLAGWRPLLPALVGIVLHQMIQLAGLRLTSATHTAWILTLIPPATGTLAWLFLGERMTRRQACGLAVALAGVMLFVSRGDLSRLSLSGNRGDLLALASVGTWSAYTVMCRALVGRHHPLFLSAAHMGLGFVFFLVLGAAGIPAQAAALDARDWAAVVVIGVLPSGLAYYWWNAGLRALGSVNTSVFLFLEAVVASFSGALVLGEAFTRDMAAYAVVMAAGVFFSVKKGRR